ncbi:mitochondrial ATP-dependent Clp protease subunit ClpP [Andalucia godoyi]|uniref:ATP-dependent Clp protease proteolytic subunit n=1 Tax=Andalucia godoyi TaxID=505711 RepID=A0A8K0AGC4_ANDGO|nr:mitochondrial ATP-dependent Clp protease subunit ClpP [Andalucia godoyi]|eukprot:ANDGO_05057.mRNA.1 mitochondrial ATP-dependent Clp protease subunit ClpP
MLFARRLLSAGSRRFSSLVPIVISNASGRGERAMDIYSRLLEDRIVCLSGAIDEPLSSAIVAQLLFLDAEDAHKPISMFINSPGGEVTSGLAIYDCMKFIRAPVSTVCVGQACSMAAVLLAGGSSGQRRILPNARVMLHQPHGGFNGQASDIEIAAKEILYLKERLLDLLSTDCKQERGKLKEILDRDYYLHAKEAKEFGIVDEIIFQRR